MNFFWVESSYIGLKIPIGMLIEKNQPDTTENKEFEDGKKFDWLHVLEASKDQFTSRRYKIFHLEIEKYTESQNPVIKISRKQSNLSLRKN